MENHNDDLFFAESAPKALQVIMKRMHDREMMERELEYAGSSNPDLARMLADCDLRYEEYELHSEKLRTDPEYREQARRDIIATGQRQLDELIGSKTLRLPFRRYLLRRGRCTQLMPASIRYLELRTGH